MLIGANFGNVPPSDVIAYEAEIGAVDFVNLHTGRAGWSDYLYSVAYEDNLYQRIRPYHWSVPMFVEGGSATLAGAAAGDYDAYWQTTFISVLAHSPSGTSPIYLRTGWEFNLAQPWYSGGGKQASFIAAWRRMVAIIRAISPRFRLVWCPGFHTVTNGVVENPALSYPGDDVVDVVSMDFYVWAGFTGTSEAAWAYAKTGSTSPNGSGFGLDWLVKFANAHEKPVAIDEWGICFDGYGSYVTAAFQYFRSNGFLYAAVWQSNEAYFGILSTSQYPTTAAQYKIEVAKLRNTTMVEIPTALLNGSDVLTALNRWAPRHDYICATKGMLTNATGRGGGDTNTQHLSRVAFTTGPDYVTDLRAVYAVTWMQGSNAGESGIGNAVALKAAFEGNGFNGRIAKFAGQDSITIPNNSLSLYMTDPYPGRAPPFTTMHMRTLVTVNAGEYWPLGFWNGSSTGAVKGTSLDSQLTGGGFPTGTAEPGQFGPIAIIGRSARSGRSVIFPGSSLEDGTNDSPSSGVYGALGYLQKALVNGGVNPIPHSRLSMGSETLGKLNDTLVGRIRSSLGRYASDCFIGAMASNDIANGATLATVQAEFLKTAWNAKSQGCRVWTVTIPPRCYATNFSSSPTTPATAPTSLANQTILPGFGIGEPADLFNQWLLTLVGTVLDGVYDLSAVCADANNRRNWRPDIICSRDGVHFEASFTDLVAASFRTFVDLRML